MESDLQLLDHEMVLSRNGLFDLPTGVWVGDYVPRGKMIQKGDFLFDFSKDEVSCLDLNRWGWLRHFSAHSINEKVLHIDPSCLHTEKSVFLYSADPERITLNKIFQHDHDVRSLVVINAYLFAAYYKTGEIQIFERCEETFYL